MRRLTHALACLYVIAAGGLIYCAKGSEDHHATGYGLFFAGCAVLFGGAVFHHACHRDELRAARADIERASRPAATPRPAIDGVVAVALAAACCERWWTSAGTDHDPTTCTRKDQTT